MAENLNYEMTNSWCFENSVDTCAKYGRLYTWTVAKTACPMGWHLPTREEWETLVGYAGSGAEAYKKLKSTNDWNYGGDNSVYGTDELEFSALPGSYGLDGDGFACCTGLTGYWWTASERADKYAYSRIMSFSAFVVYDGVGYKADSYSERCVRNE